MARSLLLTLQMTTLLACSPVGDSASAASRGRVLTLAAPTKAPPGGAGRVGSFARVTQAAATASGDVLAVRAPGAVPGPTVIFEGLNGETWSSRVDPGWLVDGAQPLLARLTTEQNLRLELVGAGVVYDVLVEAGQPWWPDVLWQIPQEAPGAGLVRVTDRPEGSVLEVYGTGSSHPRWSRPTDASEGAVRIGAALATPDGDRVIVLGQDSARGAWLEARRLSDGGLLWQRALDSGWPLASALNALAVVASDQPTVAIVLADRSVCEDCARVEIRSTVQGDLLKTFPLARESPFRVAGGPGVRAGLQGRYLWLFRYDPRRSGSLTTMADACTAEVYEHDQGRVQSTLPALCQTNTSDVSRALPRSLMQVSGGDLLVLRVTSATSLELERAAGLLGETSARSAEAAP